jgi:hypothetical protein
MLLTKLERTKMKVTFTFEARRARDRQARIDLLLRLVSKGEASSAQTSELKGLGVHKKDWAVTFVEKKVKTDIVSAFTREEAERIANEEFGGTYGEDVQSVEEAK